ncbi:UNVERIFIED_CONTAM: hypothetical protein FKN15_045361 [Acipenser sinensis]
MPFTTKQQRKQQHKYYMNRIGQDKDQQIGSPLTTTITHQEPETQTQPEFQQSPDRSQHVESYYRATVKVTSPDQTQHIEEYRRTTVCNTNQQNQHRNEPQARPQQQQEQHHWDQHLHKQNDIKKWQDRYSTFKPSYSKKDIEDLLNVAKSNVQNSQEEIFKQIQKAITSKQQQHGKPQ